MKYSFILVIVLVFSGKAICQESHQQLIPGLKAKIAVARDDSNKADLLIQLIDQYQMCDSFEASFINANANYNLALKLNYISLPCTHNSIL